MSLGIKFRRNNKVNLMNAQEGEVVYAIDTDEWGLGIGNDTVIWRNHEIGSFTNNHHKGDGIPGLEIGVYGDYYVDTLNGEVYQKGDTWEPIVFPQDETTIPDIYIPVGTIPGFDDMTTIILDDGTKKLPNGYVAVDDNHPIDALTVNTALDVLVNDGSTQMVDGYVADTSDKVLTKLDFESEQEFKPVTTVPEIGQLWNYDGIPSIWNGLYGTYIGENEISSPDSRNYFGLHTRSNSSVIVTMAETENRGFIYQFDGTLVKEFTLVAQDGAAYGGSGSVTTRRIAVSETHIIIGSPGYDAPKTCSGRADIYDMTGTLVTTIINPNGAGSYNNFFGHAVAIHGDRVAIGSQEGFEGTQDGGYFVFSLDGTLIGGLSTNDIDGGAYAEWLGFFLTMNSTRTISTTRSSGKVIIADNNGNYISSITRPVGASSAFGRGLNCTDTHIFIGDQGVAKVYIYNLSGTLLFETTRPAGFAGEHGGWIEVDEVAEMLIVSAKNGDMFINPEGPVGVCVYDFLGNFVQGYNIPNADYYAWGWSATLRNNMAYIGANQNGIFVFPIN